MTMTIRERILAFLQTPRYSPLNRHELLAAMKIPPDERADFRQVLRRLENERIVARLRKNRFALAVSEPPSRGHLRVHPDGYGLITPENDEETRFVVAPDALANALSGDTVQFYEVSGNKIRVAGGAFLPPAQITAIIERPRRIVVGLLMKLPDGEYIIPDDRDLTANIFVRAYSPEIKQPEAHHKVVLLLDPPDSSAVRTSGTIIEDLGHEDDPGVDILSIARRKGFSASHASATTKAAEQIVALEDRHPARRRDLRQHLVFTIDPSDAKDFDDAVSLEKTAEGFLLGVHIADVANYVTPNDPVDAEALMRGNSVYLVDRTIPMLPAHLTANICSLLPNVDRLTHTVEILLNSQGHVQQVETYPSIIHSAARLNYTEVQLLIDHGNSTTIPPELHSTLLMMRQLSTVLRSLRMRDGSIGLSLPEIKCTLNERGQPVHIGIRREVEAYQLIEEFMLLANRAVASLLFEANTPSLYRTHPAPDQDQWKRMAEELHALGISKTPKSRADINAIAASLSGSEIAYAAGTSILRNFKQAVYSAVCDHHFGLAFDHYTHFTSPIRRYADLVVHRILKAFESGAEFPYSPEALGAIARQCSACERAAMEAERESVDLKRVEYYTECYRRNRRGPWRGIISAILPIGLMVELTDTLQRGLVHFSSISPHRFALNKNGTAAVSRDREEVFTIGDSVDVELIRVDERKRQVDFRLVGQKGPKRSETAQKRTVKQHRRRK